VEGERGCLRCLGHTQKNTRAVRPWRWGQGQHPAPGTPQRDTPRPQPRCCACGQHARTPTTAALGGQVLSPSRASRPAAAGRPGATRVASRRGLGSPYTHQAKFPGETVKLGENCNPGNCLHRSRRNPQTTAAGPVAAALQ